MIDALAYCDQLASGPGRRASGRRHVLFGALAVAATGWAARNPVRACLSAAAPAATQAEAAPPADWQSFKDRFVAADGRVIDTGNGGISHSEGQGYGLLFAERFGDRDVFDRLLGWTEANLRRRSDALHAWRYRPGAAVPVDDWNNASDGDLLIAWALLRAGQRWGNQDYTDLGTAIATDLLALCVREVAGTTVLLPAASGFERPGRVIVNPSYATSSRRSRRWRTRCRTRPGRSCRRTGCTCCGSRGSAAGSCRRIGWKSAATRRTRCSQRATGRRGSPGTRCGCRCTSPGPG